MFEGRGRQLHRLVLFADEAGRQRGHHAEYGVVSEAEMQRAEAAHRHAFDGSRLAPRQRAISAIHLRNHLFDDDRFHGQLAVL